MVSDRPQAADMRLRGRTLLLARVAWVAVAALSVGLFVAGIPAEFAQLQVPCPTAVCSSGQLPPAGLRSLEDLGFSLGPSRPTPSRWTSSSRPYTERSQR